MRKLVAMVFHYSLNGLLAEDGTEYWDYCMQMLDDAGGAVADETTLELLRNAEVHIMDRGAYEGMADDLPQAPEHPWSSILNDGRKVVFSKSLKKAAWKNTTIASGKIKAEIEKLRTEGDGYIVVWGGTQLWKSLIERDLIDEFR